MASSANLFPVDAAAAAGVLADHFAALSDAADRLTLNAPADQAAVLSASAQRLMDFSHRFTADAIAATLASVQGDLAAIQSATKTAKEQLAVLTDITKAVAIAGAAVGLGAAIVLGDAGGIIGAAGALASAAA